MKDSTSPPDSEMAQSPLEAWKIFRINSENPLVKYPYLRVLILLLILSSILPASDPRDSLIWRGSASLVGAVALYLAVAAAGARPREKLMQAGLLGAAVLLGMSIDFGPQDQMAKLTGWFLDLFLWAAAALMAALFIIHDLFRQGREKTNHVFAALSLYLLIGHIWAFLYFAVWSTDPAAFRFATSPNVAGEIRLDELMYLSFITLTTVGYGDVTPVSGLARGLAVIEGTLGVMLLATVVARFVSGAGVSQAKSPDGS